MTDREYVKCQSAVVKAWDVLQMTLCESYGYEGLQGGLKAERCYISHPAGAPLVLPGAL